MKRLLLGLLLTTLVISLANRFSRAQTTPAHSVTINLAGSDPYTVFRCTYNTAAPCTQLAAGVTATYTDTTVAAGATYYYWFLDTKQNTPDGYLVVTVSQVTTQAVPSTNITTATVQ